MVRRIDTYRDVLNAYEARDRYELEKALERHLARCENLFDAVAHGSDEHRDWLKQAIADHFAGKLVQPVR